MKITDIVLEDSVPATATNDYQKMLSFVNSNRVAGVPANQQIALALFKELQKQKEQNQHLAAELSAAEQRIDTATQSGELQGQELTKHRGELEREREAGRQQQQRLGQIDTQYAERAQASDRQIADLTDRLEAVKRMPGVGEDAAKKLEKQIEELKQKGMSAEKAQEIESRIVSIQQMQKVDDNIINQLTQDVQAAQAAAKELEKTKADLGKDIQSQLAHFKEVEKTVASLRNELNNLETGYEETDATVFDLENEVHRLKTQLAAKNAVAKAGQMVQPASQGQPTAPQASNQPKYTPKQIEIAKKLGLSGDLEQPTPSFAVAEAAFKRSIAWATGKKL